MPSFDFSVREPRTREDIVEQLCDLHRVSTAFWESFATDAFFAPVGSGWSPDGNVRHLNMAMRPLARALRLPRFLPGMLFGKAREPSRSYAGVRDTYRATLAAGAGAGSFAPKASQRLGDVDGARKKLMATREDVANSLTKAIGRWNEADLNRYRLPHPLLGKLTVREMLFFTVYHNYHHVRSVADRLCAGREEPSTARA